MRVADREGAFADERERHALLAAALERERGADRHGHEVAEHRDEREDVARGHAEVHVPVASARRPVAAAEEVPQRVCDGARRARSASPARG